MLIQISDALFFYDEKKVFEGVNLQINELDRIGLIGRNGEGKTTLINALIKENELRGGYVTHKSGLSIGYLRQNSGLDSGNTVFEEMRNIFSEVMQTEKELRALEQRLSALDHESAEYHSAAARYDAKTAYFIAKDGYNTETKIKTVLNGMGFAGMYDQVINTMSGGEKTRLAICSLLLTEPELLILDEPTNHLDFSTLQWLEGYLSAYKGALLIVSHDRYFLDKLVNKVWEIENYGVKEFSGNYSKYRVLKDAYLDRVQKEYVRQQEKISKMLDYAARNIARASTSNSAKSRLKQVANMEKIDKPYVENRKPRFDFAFDAPSLKNVITVKNLTLSAGGRTLIDNVSLEVLRGEKVALLGANGTGKSTFIKKVVAAVKEGFASVHIGQGVTVSYYDQENVDLDQEQTVLEGVWGRYYRQSQTYVRKILAQALLAQEDMDKRVKELSGGERAKLGLAMMVMERANTLIMDEPTNHLDLISRESLEEAMKDFGGTILFVSHDRYFINKIATKIVEITGRKFTVYEGGFEEYQVQKARDTQAVDAPALPENKEKPKKAYLNTQERKRLANAKIRLKEIESRVNELEGEYGRLEGEIILPEIVSDYKKAGEKSREMERIKAELNDLLAEWENLAALLV